MTEQPNNLPASNGDIRFVTIPDVSWTLPQWVDEPGEGFYFWSGQSDGWPMKFHKDGSDELWMFSKAGGGHRFVKEKWPGKWFGPINVPKIQTPIPCPPKIQPEGPAAGST